MAMPWEKAAAEAAEEATAKMPWQKAAEQVAKDAGRDMEKFGYGSKPDPDGILQQMPEGVSKVDRFKVANFSNDPKEAAEWLRKKYPNFEVGLIGDQIGMKPMGATGPFKAIIPEAAFSDIWKQPSNLLQKITDNIALGGQTIASTVAAGSAGAAALPTGPFGALAAGALAGGATNAAAEAARQEYGQQIGLNKKFDPGPVVSSGVIGGAGPLLFGTGQGVQGLAGKAYDTFTSKVAPKFGEIISGVPAKTISNAAARMPEVKALEKDGVLDFAGKAHENIADNLQAAKTKIGKNISSSIENAGGVVDVKDAIKPFDDLLAKLDEQYQSLRTPELKDKIKEVEKKLKYYFSKEPLVDTALDPATGLPEKGLSDIVENLSKVTPAQAFNLKQSMADLGELDKVKQYGITSSLSGMSAADRELAIAARQSKAALDKGIGDAVDLTENITGGMSNLRGQYRDLMNMQDYLEPQFKTPEKTFNTMRNMSGKNKEVLMQTLRGVDDKYGTNALSNAELLDAYNTFGNPSFNPLSTRGSTSTGRAIPLAGVSAAIGSSISNKMGMGYMPGAVAGLATGATLGSPAALRQYMNVGAGIRGTQRLLGRSNLGIPLGAGNYYLQDNEELQSPWSLFPQDTTKGAPK